MGEHHGRRIAEIEQEMRAFPVDAVAMAKALMLKVGASALKIVLRYFDADGNAFEISALVHPAERFSVSMRLRR